MVTFTALDKLVEDDKACGLIELTEERLSQGLTPPAEIYRVEYRRLIDWSKMPTWARPMDPELFAGCCHEG